MESPQLEDGYIPIANEIVEALSRIRIPGEAMQVLWVILRKTYGYGKKEDAISLSQFSQATNMYQSNVVRALQKLIDMAIIIKIKKDNEQLSKKIMPIIKKDNGNSTTYCFNENFEQWKPLKKVRRGIIKKDNEQLSKKIHTKYIYKDSFSRYIYKDSSSKEKEDKKGIIKKDNAKSIEAWLHSLSENPAYQGINIERLWGKMVAWCEVNHKQPTRRRFINWLNREERPIIKTATTGVKGAIDYSQYR